MKNPLLIAGVLGTALAFSAVPSPGHALTACQSECNNQYFNTVNGMWQTPHPATTSMPDYRKQVLAALETLNGCMAACGTASTTPTTPTEPAVPVNLAIGKTATASLTSGSNAPSLAVDGDSATYWWAKSTAAHWLQVDLGGPATVSKVTIQWGSNYATGYNIQISADAKTWTAVYTTTAGKGGSVEHALTPVTARYIRVNCTKANGRNGYAVTELGVIGN